MAEDLYRTIEAKSEGIYKEKGSKFIAYAYPVASEDEIKDILSVLKKEYYDARHHCYAYVLGADKSKSRANDDGEPSSTAGKPILGQIMSNDLTNIFIVVIRYFGGTKLGVSGLINAYKTAAADAIENASIIEKTVNDYYKFVFHYVTMNDVMKLIKDENLEMVEHKYDNVCEIVVSIRQGEVEKIKSRAEKIDGINFDYIITV